VNVVNPATFGSIDPKDWRDIPDHYTDILWPESGFPREPRDYGNNAFHGRTHPELIAVALERYTKPGDLVWDPMAGSGTTGDVCAELDRRYIMSDLYPYRDDIIQADARDWRPDEPVDLVICHPPYMDIIPYGPHNINGNAPEAGGKDDANLATDDFGYFHYSMQNVFDNIKQAMKPGHVMLTICGAVYKDTGRGFNEVILLDAEFYDMLVGEWRLLGRIVRGFGETKGGSSTGPRTENLWKYRRLKGGYWGLGVDTAMFWQLANL
jgi:hypothetical protein